MERTRNQTLNELYQAVAEHLAKEARNHVPETGRFQKYTVEGHIKGEKIRGILGIEEGYKSDSDRCVSLGVHWDDDDRLLSNFLFTGTKQEVLEWLESQDGQRQIMNAYMHLEEKLIRLF